MRFQVFRSPAPNWLCVVLLDRWRLQTGCRSSQTPMMQVRLHTDDEGADDEGRISSADGCVETTFFLLMDYDNPKGAGQAATVFLTF